MGAVKKNLTLLVVPDGSARVQRFVVSKKVIASIIFASCFVFVIGTFMLVHYLHIVDQAMENSSLKEENLALKSQIKELQTQMKSAMNVITRVERFETKLRMMLQLSDPERNLAIGPVSASPESHETPLFGELLPGIKESRAGQMLRLSLLRNKVETIKAEAEKTEEGMRELKAFFDAQRSVLASTPSSWPVHGWITSNFGYRYDPYTAEKSFHRGIDITSQMGTPVLASADGQIISAVYDPNYGKMILIDHGNSVVTRYAHLSEVNVSEGDRVQRGQLIGAVGNTGRSTGSHLHYEVEVNGIAVNPLKYILE